LDLNMPELSGNEVLENFTLDSDGKLVEGTLKMADGSIQYFHHGELRTRWPQAYESAACVQDDAVVVEDGNTRLTAIAIRHRRREPMPDFVGVFITKTRSPASPSVLH
ncbi:MAG: hypothetical protein M1608_05720, partial [Candidatus Omnitrophica bacterium]|nr:hypothetical protein [Candidatus Omnitrophota bacterium]